SLVRGSARLRRRCQPRLPASERLHVPARRRVPAVQPRGEHPRLRRRPSTALRVLTDTHRLAGPAGVVGLATMSAVVDDPTSEPAPEALHLDRSVRAWWMRALLWALALAVLCGAA